MIGYQRRFRVFALCLAALAGCVDAIGFVLSGGLFVSFMSGNSTRLAVESADGSRVALLSGGLIACFFAGVVLGALLASWRAERRKTVVLGLSTASLFTSAILAESGIATAAVLVLALGMGVLNNVFLREGEVSIAVTYMTGTLVRAGQRVAARLRGDTSSDWQSYLLLWLSLLAGATAGAFVATRAAVLGIWLAAALSAGLTGTALWLERTRCS